MKALIQYDYTTILQELLADILDPLQKKYSLREEYPSAKRKRH